MKRQKETTGETMKMTAIKTICMIAVLAAAVTANAAKMNVSTALGSTIQTDFAVTEKGSVGGIIGLSNAGGYSLGVGYNHMFSQPIMSSGWSVNSSLMYYSSTGLGSNGFTLGALSQYNAFWDNGFNMNAGIGLQYAQLNTNNALISKISGVLPALGLNIGYAF